MDNLISNTFPSGLEWRYTRQLEVKNDFNWESYIGSNRAELDKSLNAKGRVFTVVEFDGIDTLFGIFVVAVVFGVLPMTLNHAAGSGALAVDALSGIAVAGGAIGSWHLYRKTSYGPLDKESIEDIKSNFNHEFKKLEGRLETMRYRQKLEAEIAEKLLGFPRAVDFLPTR